MRIWLVEESVPLIDALLPHGREPAFPSILCCAHIHVHLSQERKAVITLQTLAVEDVVAGCHHTACRRVRDHVHADQMVSTDYP